MSTRIFFAGILGGIVMFIWSFIAHELLPIGELGVREIPNEDALTSAIESNLGDKIGFYIFPSPGLSPGATRAEKEEGMKKAEQKMAPGRPVCSFTSPSACSIFRKDLESSSRPRSLKPSWPFSSSRKRTSAASSGGLFRFDGRNSRRHRHQCSILE